MVFSVPRDDHRQVFLTDDVVQDVFIDSKLHNSVFMTANLCTRERKVGVKVTLLLRQDVHQPLLIRACHQLRLGRRGPHLLRLGR